MSSGRSKTGRDGFGVVWAAEQREPVRRRVALKIITDTWKKLRQLPDTIHPGWYSPDGRWLLTGMPHFFARRIASRALHREFQNFIANFVENFVEDRPFR